YSTCSLSRKQNEDIIEWFLLNHSDAKLETIPYIANMTLAPLKGNNSGSIDLSKAVRFDSIYSKTSGFFLTRIRKLSLSNG
ncbi:95_t:CDS:1, partial [Acaulospora morrowiae]